MMDLIRRCDLVLLLVDLQTDPLQQLEDTVVLLRDGESGLEAYLVKRHGRTAFGNAWAFPGGVVDAAVEVFADDFQRVDERLHRVDDLAALVVVDRGDDARRASRRRGRPGRGGGFRARAVWIPEVPQ